MIFASGLKYVGVPTYPLGWTMGGILLAGAAYWLVRTRLVRTRLERDKPPVPAPPEPSPADTVSDVSVR